MTEQNSFLFMLATHGDGVSLAEGFSKEAVKYIEAQVKQNKDSKIYIGFDGDGAYGKVWPTPTSTALSIIDKLISQGFKDIVLAQSQVFSLCEGSEYYSKHVVPRDGIKIYFHRYKDPEPEPEP